MTEEQKKIFRFGTTETPKAAQPVHAGNLTATIEAGALRALSVGGLELVRQIDFPIRDEDWASLPPNVLSETLEETEDGFRYEIRFDVDDGALECCVVYQASAQGWVLAEGEATAHRDFTTNRTGFTVLHPIEGFSGQPVSVRHASGGTADAVMPDLIKPSQPIKDIAGLRFDVDGVSLDIAFDGDVFEMEDQRNWSDASYKTYSRPLVDPFAYVIKAGETQRQSIRVTMTGAPTQKGNTAGAALTFGAPSSQTVPQILLALQDGWLADEAQLQTLVHTGVKGFLLRVTPENAADLLPTAKAHLQATAGQLDLEIVLDDDQPAAPQIAAVANACQSAGVTPAHVIALPAAFLASYQPSGAWPEGLSPEESFAAAKTAFPDAQIGAGMLTNFTELNRRRPDQCASDYIAHGNSATVHAADDTSVMQTLETLPQIFRSARSIAGDQGYRVGLTAIGMRTNPYGDGTVPNPDQKRLTMAVWDPRVRGLLGASWLVGVLAATQDSGVEAIALGAPVGPFGVLSSAQDVARPWFDDHSKAQVYPAFHVLRALSSAGDRLPLSGLPSGLAGVAVQNGERRRFVVANLTGQSQTMDFPAAFMGAALDTDSFEAAVLDPLWLDHSQTARPAGPIALAPYAILFGDTVDG